MKNTNKTTINKITDLSIEKETKLSNITNIAKKLGLSKEDIILYGNNKAKINLSKLYSKNLKELERNEKNSKLILVTSMSPTQKGMGKTTTTIGVADSLKRMGKKVVAVLREPSLGPVFGLKGGATGAGYSSVTPIADINLHFNGDFHAITTANNLVSSALENHIFFGNDLDIDLNRITWERCIDLNDRSLRKVEIIISEEKNLKYTTKFNITSASELMGIFVLSKDFKDLENRLNNTIIAYSNSNLPITIKDLKVTGSILALLKEAFYPNLVQTLRATPAIIHGGPFANISIGVNTVIASKVGKQLADIVVTEAGFGSDLGAEKFLNIVANENNLVPDLTIIVATISSLKMQAGISKEDLDLENVLAINNGFENLKRHISNIRTEFNLPVIVAINKFPNDTIDEISKLEELLKDFNTNYFFINPFDKIISNKVANTILTELENTTKTSFTTTYTKNDTIEEKIQKVVTKLYKAKSAVFTELAKEKLKEFESNLDYKNYYICIAKTPLSFTTNKDILNAPTDFEFLITDLKLATGGKYIIVYADSILTMPGLSKNPLLEQISLDEDNNIINMI